MSTPVVKAVLARAVRGDPFLSSRKVSIFGEQHRRSVMGFPLESKGLVGGRPSGQRRSQGVLHKRGERRSPFCCLSASGREGDRARFGHDDHVHGEREVAGVGGAGEILLVADPERVDALKLRKTRAFGRYAMQLAEIEVVRAGANR
jgi:hypothetical protein